MNQQIFATSCQRFARRLRQQRLARLQRSQRGARCLGRQRDARLRGACSDRSDVEEDRAACIARARAPREDGGTPDTPGRPIAAPILSPHRRPTSGPWALSKVATVLSLCTRALPQDLHGR